MSQNLSSAAVVIGALRVKTRWRQPLETVDPLPTAVQKVCTIS